MKKSIILIVLWLLAGCASAVATTTSTTPASVEPTLPSAGQSTPISPTPAVQGGDQSFPLTWSGHGLAGHLLLILYQDYGDQLISLDLATGKYQLLYQAPDKSKLTGASLSPDGKQYLLTYSAPTGQIQLGNTDLFLLPAAANSQPQPLQMRKANEESYFDATWNKDGTKIFYSHFYQLYVNKVPVYKYEIESIDLSGHSETLIPDSYWPVLSPDNSKISYIFSDPKLFSNDLYIADVNGKNSKAISNPGTTPPVDAHLFSKDGKTIFFSMVNAQTQPVRFWWENLFGIETVSAHNVPSDWYKVPAAGGEIERITNVNDTGMFGDLSPDGSRLVFISANGLSVVKTDGSDLVKLSDSTFDGTVQWLP
ncbi:MAG TPA: hypothetical protein VMS73_05720 [Anaerolineaceae bacterium]|nr:hypothetical protein [Anaerolineaceae bacterium]